MALVGSESGRYSAFVRSRVEVYREALLPGWRIVLRDDLPDDMERDDEGPAAVIGWDDNLYTANLYLSDDVLNGGTAYLNSTIIHELMHPMFRELRFAFMPDEKSDRAGHERWEFFEERIVERVALGMADRSYPSVIHASEI